MRRIKVILSMLLVLMLSACDTEPTRPSFSQEPIKLGTNIWPGYEPLYLARSLGSLNHDEIRLVEYPSASEVIRAFTNRSIEAAALTLDEVLVLLQNQIPVKVILVMDISDGGDVIMAKPEIKSFSQLRGKVVGVENGALGAYVISRALEINGMSLADIAVKSAQVSYHEQAFLKDEIDAVVTFEPVRSKLMSVGAQEVFTSREIPGEIVDVLVVHEDVLRDRKVALKEMLQSWFDALNYMAAKPRAAAELMADRLGVSPEEVTASYEGLVLPSRQENKKMIADDLNRTAARIYKVMRERELLHSDVPLEGIFVDIQ